MADRSNARATRARGDHSTRGEGTEKKRTATRRSAPGGGSRRAVERRNAHVQARDTDVDSLQLFFKDAARYPLLTAAEEVELAKRIERGDLEAKERMVNSNLRLVISNARRYQGQGLTLGDLIQEGVVGLIRATEKFDWRRGFKFSTYATAWIRQSMQRALSNTAKTIRIPVHIEQRQRNLARAERELAAKLGRDPSDEELAEAAKMELDEVLQLRNAAAAVASLDAPVGEEEETSFGDLLASEQVEPVEELVDNERSTAVKDALAGLEQPERKVIELRFGLADGQERTLVAIGRELGLTESQVHRVEESALRKLRDEDRLDALREAA